MSECDKDTSSLPGQESRACFRHQLADRIGAGDRPIMLLHPGSGGRGKCAPLETFESIQKDAKRRGYATAWMIGPDECERDGLPLIARLERSAPVIIEEDVAVAADLLAGADAFAGNDAGMTHLAALLGLETTVLYISTSPDIWKPVGRSVHTIDARSDQNPCTARNT